MATAYLLPQDCLPTTKARHKASFSDALHGSDVSAGGRDAFQVSNPLRRDQSRHKLNNLNRRGVWAAIPEQAAHHEQVRMSTSVQKKVDVKKTKAWMPAENRAHMSNVPVLMILPRPKDRETANEGFEKRLVKLDETMSATGFRDFRIEVKPNESNLSSDAKHLSVKEEEGAFYLKKGFAELAAEGFQVQGSHLDVPKLQSSSTMVNQLTSKDIITDIGKHHNVNLSPSELTSVAKRSSHIRLDEVVSVKGLNQMLSPEASGEHQRLRMAGAVENLSQKPADAKHSAKVYNAEEAGSAQLKRSSTDPQIVKHLVIHYKSKAMEIPHKDTRSLCGIMRTTSMSDPERWAGPAYSSSPAPSSLPLPKFFFTNQKKPSTNCPLSTIQGPKRNLPQLSESAAVRALPVVPRGGGLDVVSATRSLRRMLKLETS